MIGLPGWESVINDNLLPLPKVVELEPEDPGIVLLKALVPGDDPVHEVLVLRQDGERGQEPAVPDLALVHVKPVLGANKQLGSLTRLLLGADLMGPATSIYWKVL